MENENKQPSFQDYKDMIVALEKRVEDEIKDSKMHIIVTQAYCDKWKPILGESLGYDLNKVVLHIGYPKFDK